MAYVQTSPPTEVNAHTALVNALSGNGYVLQSGGDPSANFWLIEAIQNIATFIPASVTGSITPAALATGPSVGEQTFAAFSSKLLTTDKLLTTITGAQTAAVALVYSRCSVAGTLALTFIATAGTPTPASGNHNVAIIRS